MEQWTANTDNSYAAWVGFDWGDREHAWVIQWADTGQREQGRLEQSPEALDAWVCQWMSRLNGRRMAVAIEQKHGAVVWMLLKYDCVEIYPIHPQATGQFRQALYPSGSKSDPTDADLLLELLVHHRDRLRPLEHEDETIRRLVILVEQRRHWVEEKKRHGNRQRAQRKTLEAFLRRHRRSPEEAVAWVDQVRAALPAVQDAALMESYVLEVTALVGLLNQMKASIQKFDDVIQELSRQHPHGMIAQSLPGAGPVMAPRLLPRWGADIDKRLLGRCNARPGLHPCRWPADEPRLSSSESLPQVPAADLSREGATFDEELSMGPSLQ